MITTPVINPLPRLTTGEVSNGGDAKVSIEPAGFEHLTTTNTPGAEWLRQCLTRYHDVDLIVDSRVTHPVAVDRAGRTIALPYGHSFHAAYRLVTDALLYVVGGSTWMQDFIEPPRQSGTVIPFPPRPW